MWNKHKERETEAQCIEINAHKKLMIWQNQNENKEIIAMVDQLYAMNLGLGELKLLKHDFVCMLTNLLRKD